MCGIFVEISRSGSQEQKLIFKPKEETKELISRRGPDHFGTVDYEIDGCCVSISASVLSMRGNCIQTQPICNDSLAFCWNGEAYSALFPLIPNVSDSIQIFNSLSSNSHENFSILQSVKGEFAFVILDLKKKCLYFGRDVFGRRSLLIQHNSDKIFLSSVAIDMQSKAACNNWDEVECQGYWQLNLQDFSLNLFPWTKTFQLNPTIEPLLHLESQIAPLNLDVFVDKFLNQLNESVKRRLILSENQKSIAVLFSGGLDCTVLARLADLLLPLDIDIDLFNVAFENKRFLSNTTSSTYDVPDRKSGIESFLELKQKSKRKFRFIMVNVSEVEYEKSKPHIISLLHPANSVMDLSIAIAVWHASSGIGIDYDSNTPYNSTAKVIFSGIGADEQLAGYTRHRNRFEREGWDGLRAELQLDLNRIWVRNLGRDDRCISDHGKEGRFPYLDEDFVKFACSLPLRIKCDLEEPGGKGDKKILRLTAERIGIMKAAGFPKRAIQFGAKTAKMMNSKENGDDLL